MNAISYFLREQNSIANENCKLYFDFNTNNVSNPYVINLSGNQNYSGVINSFQSTFWNIADSGLFSGQFVSITGNNDTGVNIIHNDITFCMVYEHFSKNGGILISTVETGLYQTYDNLGNQINTGIFKGFNFGFTANNRLFFEYYNNNALEAYTSTFSLSQKSSVFLTIFNNNINLGYYDFFRDTIVEDSFFIESDFLFDYSSVYLGYNNNLNNTIFYTGQYTGYIDTFLIFSPSIFNIDITAVNSGIAYTYNSGNIEIQDNSITGITGYTSQITGYLTGVTGTVLVPTGVVVNPWGVQFTGYLESGITGLIPQIGNSGLTGVIESIFTTGIAGESLELNKSLINSFGKQVINYLSKISSEDFLELQFFTDSYTGITNLKNIKAQYLPYENTFSIPNENINDFDTFIIFANGQLQSSGKSYFTGNGYQSGVAVVNDYILDSKKNIIFNNQYQETDSIFVDLALFYNTGLYIENFYVPSGAGNFTVTGWSGNLNNIYFNGLKLSEDIHYTTVAPEYDLLFNRASPLYSGATGILSAVRKSSNFNITGTNSNVFMISNKYLYNLSEIYKNGIRQTLDTDYLELAFLDTNTGVGFFDIKEDIIYNNEGLFLI